MIPPGDWVIHRYVSLPSTMDRAAFLARHGARDRTAVLAAEQTAGRGRAGRSWVSPPGTAISCTLILRPPVAADRLASLSLIAGVAVAEAIEDLTGAPARLKWPNDVWLGNDPARQKVAGILLTSHLAPTGVEHVLIGIGVNVASRIDELPPGATSVAAATSVEVSLETMTRQLLERFDQEYAAYVAAGGRPSLDAWRSRAALAGEVVSIIDGMTTRRGTFADIDDGGALLLVDANGHTLRVVAGDLVRGPKPDQAP